MEKINEDFISEDIQNAIKNLIKKMGIKNYTMDISSGSLPGDNYMGIITRVVVTGKNKTSLSFIIKTAPKPDDIKASSQIRNVFEREIFMYSKVFPAFAKFQEDKDILTPFKPFAKYYPSTMEESGEALIMEDMKALGFSLCDRREPLDYNHVLLVMREYGKLHALSYAFRDQQPELFNKFSEKMKDRFFENFPLSEDNLKAMRHTTDRALKSLNQFKDKVAYNKFKNYQDTMFDQVSNAVRSETAGKYCVITHGDCWINNILFKYKNSSTPNLPTELCFIDWQLTRSASPALDLSYFLYTCTDKKLRDEHYDDMIQEYYSSLTSFLTELGSDPEKMFPFEMLKEHLKKFSVFALYISNLVLYAMLSEDVEILDMQSSTNNSDEDVQNFCSSSKNEEKYQKRMRDVILDFIKYGYEF